LESHSERAETLSFRFGTTDYSDTDSWRSLAIVADVKDQADLGTDVEFTTDPFLTISSKLIELASPCNTVNINTVDRAIK
jgi:hypothetical protein